MKSIQDYWLKIKLALEGGVEEYGMFVLVALIALSCFGLGRLSAFSEEKPDITISEAQTASQTLSAGGKFAGSQEKRTYFYPWCADLQKTESSDLIWFASQSEAEAAGYAPAPNCRGLVSSKN